MHFQVPLEAELSSTAPSTQQGNTTKQIWIIYKLFFSSFSMTEKQRIEQAYSFVLRMPFPFPSFCFRLNSFSNYIEKKITSLIEGYWPEMHGLLSHIAEKLQESPTCDPCPENGWS